MTPIELKRLLEGVRSGAVPADTASEAILAALRASPIDDLGFARVDVHRELRQGFPEVILGVGKTPSQIAAIAERLAARGQALLVTRATPEAFAAVSEVVPGATYHREARAITLRQGEIPAGR